jgi:hypothetical protein
MVYLNGRPVAGRATERLLSWSCPNPRATRAPEIDHRFDPRDPSHLVLAVLAPADVDDQCDALAVMSEVVAEGEVPERIRHQPSSVGR